MRRLKIVVQALQVSLTRLRGSVALRLLIAVLLFSSAVTLALTAIQLALEYQRGRERIEQQLADIHHSYLDSLAEGLWRLDQDYLQIQVKGILRLPEIRAVEVREASSGTTALVVTAGERGAHAALAREFPIFYGVQGSAQRIGSFYVEATLTGLYREVITSALVILVSQGLKTFLVSLFILYIVQRLITRHLAAVADFVRGFDLRHPPPPLRLPRAPPQKPDELDQVVAAFNAMCTSLQQAYDDLRVHQARIRQLVEADIIGVVFVDAGGHVMEANDAFLQMLGYRRQDVLAGRINWKALTAPEYLDTSERAADEIRRTGRCTPFETEYLRRDGSRVPVLVGGVRLEEAPDQIVSFVLDLSERKAAEAERLARLAAEAANRAKSEFLATMSHELRTPLNGILGYAQILLRDKRLNEREIAGLNVIQQSGEHLLTLINDILDFARIEAGRLELYVTDIEFIKFLHLIGEMIEVKAAQKDLNFSWNMAPDVPAWVRADEKRLRQVLLNLLSNAVKFTDRGMVRLCVGMSAAGRIRFEVQDSGIGIGADQLEAIFMPFEQAGDMQRRAGGSGLGLTISRQFVRLMGGEIEVESRVGEGSTFWFELDLPAVASKTVVARELDVAGYEGSRKKILVVDDIAENRAVAVDMLSPLGFEMSEAASGAAGLEQAQALQPDLILMDLVMPGMGGLEATRRLRALPAFKEVPIIAISASASISDQEKSLAAGANAFLPKPVEYGSLLTQVARLLQLDLIYETPRPAPASADADAAALVAPPEDEIEMLYHLARLGNMQDILRWANRLEALDGRYQTFADQLRALAKGYQSKAILNLAKRYLVVKEVS